MFPTLASSVVLLFSCCLAAVLPVPKDNQSNSMLPTKSLATDILLFRRLHA